MVLSIYKTIKKAIKFDKKSFFIIKIYLSLNICGYLNITLDKIHNS